VDGRPNRRNKATFSSFSGVVLPRFQSVVLGFPRRNRRHMIKFIATFEA